MNIARFFLIIIVLFTSPLSRAEGLRPWVSISPVGVEPSGRIFEGFAPSLGLSFDLRVQQTNYIGAADGFYTGISYQVIKLKYESFGGSITLTQIYLEIGHAFPFGLTLSSGYVAIGWGTLAYKGSLPEGDFYNTEYFGKSHIGLRLKGGLSAKLSRYFGIDFGMAVDFTEHMERIRIFTGTAYYRRTVAALVALKVGIICHL